MCTHGIFLSKSELKKTRSVSCLVCSTAKLHIDNNYSIIIMSPLALAHSLHILCIFITAICTTAKWNKTYTRKHFTVHSIVQCLCGPIPFHFWVVVVLNCSGKLTLCQRCKNSFWSRDNPTRATHYLSVIILLLCDRNARSEQKKEQKQNHMYVHLPSSQDKPHRVHCFSFINLLLSCQFFDETTFPPWNYLIFNSWCFIHIFHFERIISLWNDGHKP